MIKFAPERIHIMPRSIRLTALTATLLLAFPPFFAVAAQEHTQEKEKETKTPEKEKPSESTPPAKEESSAPEHPIKLGGQTIPYKPTAATILLKNEKDEP